MWEVNTVMGAGEAPPHVANSCSGLLTVMGGAVCVWDDLQNIAALFGKKLGPMWHDDDLPCDLMAINDIGAYWHGKLHHWVTLHGMYMAGWHKFRTKHAYGAGAGVEVHADKPAEAIDHIWDIPNVGGSSGLFACKIALVLGYNKIILAGMPMDDSRHFFDAPWYQGAALHNRPEELVWIQARNEVFGERVKSMSGRTKQWLGEPTKEWLEGR